MAAALAVMFATHTGFGQIPRRSAKPFLSVSSLFRSSSRGLLTSAHFFHRQGLPSLSVSIALHHLALMLGQSVAFLCHGPQLRSAEGKASRCRRCLAPPTGAGCARMAALAATAISSWVRKPSPSAVSSRKTCRGMSFMRQHHPIPCDPTGQNGPASPATPARPRSPPKRSNPLSSAIWKFARFCHLFLPLREPSNTRCFYSLAIPFKRRPLGFFRRNKAKNFSHSPTAPGFATWRRNSICSFILGVDFMTALLG